MNQAKLNKTLVTLISKEKQGNKIVTSLPLMVSKKPITNNIVKVIPTLCQFSNHRKKNIKNK